MPAEEVRDPERTIPRTTILGTLATTIVYDVAIVAVLTSSRSTNGLVESASSCR